MRAILAFAALLMMSLAGCLSEPSPDTDSMDVADLPAAAPRFDDAVYDWQFSSWYENIDQFDVSGSHPAFNFPTSSALPLVGESATGLPADWRRPVPAPLPETISALVHEGNIQGVDSGSGIATFGPYAYAAAWNAPNMWTIDIADMKLPETVGHAGNSSSGDFDIIAYPDGMLVLVGSTRGQDMVLYDVTDPTEPLFIGAIETVNGNHNHQTIPGTPIVYNNNSGGSGSNTDIWDLSDPYNPVMVNDWDGGYGCHASSFYINQNEGKYRGYCAGIETLQIWDITDPVHPQVITTMPWPGLGDESGTVGDLSLLSFAHLAMPNHDATVLIAGDETGGGAAPGCDAYAYEPVTGTSVSGPLGNLWFYDISDEKNPVLHGSYSPAAWEQRGSCTAHFGGVIEDTNHLVMAFYTAGVALVDFNDLDNPRAVDLWQRTEEEQPCTLCGVWDAQYYQGYILTGDIDRGIDVLTLA